MTPEMVWAAICLGALPAGMAGRRLRSAYDEARARRDEEEKHEDVRLTSWLGLLRPAEQLAPAMAVAGVGRHRLRAEGLTNRHHRG